MRTAVSDTAYLALPALHFALLRGVHRTSEGSRRFAAIPPSLEHLGPVGGYRRALGEFCRCLLRADHALPAITQFRGTCEAQDVAHETNYYESYGCDLRADGLLDVAIAICRVRP